MNLRKYILVLPIVVATAGMAFYKSSFRHFGTGYAKPEAGHERRGQRNKRCGQRHWKGNEESREEDGKRHQESDEQNGAENKRRLAEG